MKHLIEWDDVTGDVLIFDGGRRVPEPGELADLAAAIDVKPLPWWLDFGAVLLGIVTVAVLGLRGYGR